jgi:Na+/melibiose symporter-like transporter
MITYDALGMELTTDYDERTSLFGWKGGFQMLGYIAVGGVGMVFAGLYPNDVGTQVLVPGLVFSAVVALAFTGKDDVCSIWRVV